MNKTKYCPHCTKDTLQRVISDEGAKPLYWCQTCFTVSAIDVEVALSVDPLRLSPEFTTTIGELDFDHRVMIDMLNDLHTLSRNKDARSVEALGTEFLRHLKAHFAREEAVLRDKGYPRLAEHADVHRRIVREASDSLSRRLCEEPPARLDGLVYSLKFCVINHLLEDMAYKTYFMEQHVPCEG